MKAPFRVPTKTRTLLIEAPLLEAGRGATDHRPPSAGNDMSWLRQVGGNAVELVEPMVMPQSHRLALHFKEAPILHGTTPDFTVRRHRFGSLIGTAGLHAFA